MLIRRERVDDVEAVAAIHRVAFARPEGGVEPVEVPLYRALRAGDDFVPALSIVATVEDVVVGHVISTRAHLGGARIALGLGPISVLPEHQAAGVGSALMHASLGAADALEYPVVCLLGDPGYYSRFGFRPAADVGITAPDESWGVHFQARTLSSWTDDLAGPFRYAAPFDDV